MCVVLFVSFFPLFLNLGVASAALPPGFAHFHSSALSLPGVTEQSHRYRTPSAVLQSLTRFKVFPVLLRGFLPFELSETELFSSLGLTVFHRLSKSVNLEYNFFSDYLIVTTNALALNQTTPQMPLSLGQICFALSHPPRFQSSQPKNNRRNSLFLCLLRVRLSSRGSRSDFLANKICSSRKNVSPPRKIHRSMSE